MQPETTVLRDKRLRKILTVNVVPGDILVLETGDKVPADAFIFEAVALKIDESSLTGESVPVGKNENEDILPELK